MFDFNWSAIENPFSYAMNGETEKQLIEQLVTDPANSIEVYSKARVRGIAQDFFRSALLRVYGGQCAFCGFNIQEALEAAHILPWAQASNQERLNVRNGLLLCSTHHKLFDKRLMGINENFRIKCSEALLNRIKEKEIREQYLELHNRPMNLPKDSKHWPNISYLG